MTTKTEVQESPEKEFRSLSSEERAIFSQIATGEPPYSQRAQALLAIDEGATQAEAASEAGLTKGQVRYWLTKFRRDRTDIIPEELLNQAQQVDAESPQSSAEDQPDLADVEETAGPVDTATAQLEDTSQVKKKSKKKPKKKTKKAKKSEKTKKQKKDKKVLKGKKSKKKNKKGKSKKAKGKKSEPGKKKRKK